MKQPGVTAALHHQPSQPLQQSARLAAQEQKVPEHIIKVYILFAKAILKSSPGVSVAFMFCCLFDVHVEHVINNESKTGLDK